MGTSFPFAAGARTGGSSAGSSGIHISALTAGSWVFADRVDHPDFRVICLARHVRLAGAAAVLEGTGVCAGHGRKSAAPGEWPENAIGVGCRSCRLER